MLEGEKDESAKFSIPKKRLLVPEVGNIDYAM